MRNLIKTIILFLLVFTVFFMGANYGLFVMEHSLKRAYQIGCSLGSVHEARLPTMIYSYCGNSAAYFEDAYFTQKQQ